MPSSPSNRFRDQWRFFRQWVRAPRETASIAPSSRMLARRMLNAAGEPLQSVIELGAGTGVFTREVLRRGVSPDHLMVVELSADMAQELQREFPSSEVVNADARELVRLVEESPVLRRAEIDAVISGLGFLSMPEAISLAILEAVFAVLKPGGRLVTFTYGRKPSIPQHLMDALRLDCQPGGRTMLNLPPAWVFVYTRKPPDGVAAG